MNTHKQIVVMVILMFVLGASCAAYTAIDLPYRSDIKVEYHETESIERGALLFANNCRGCHGDEGQGGIGLPLNVDTYKDQDPLVLEANRAKLRRTLYCGRLGTVMQPWINTNGGALNNIQIEHLINLITDPSGVGWEEAVHFSHNLNHETLAVVGGDTLASVAKTFRLGVPELLALNAGYEADQVLPKGARIALPDGRTHKVTGSNETLVKIADGQHVGEILLIELNATTIENGKTYSYDYDPKKSRFTLLVDGRSVVGVFPGTELALPGGAAYGLAVGESLLVASARTGLSVEEIRALNPDVADLPEDEQVEEPMVLALGDIDSYVMRGQSLEDVAKGYAGLSNGAAQFAEENGVPENAVLRIGQELKLPPETWGATPAGTPNDGRACVEHAVPRSVYEELTGQTSEPEPPEEISEDVEILSHGNDWQVVADGTEQEINKGVVSVASGTVVTFRNVAGIHTITINGTTEVDLIQGTDTQEWTFEDPGSYKITCDFHPDMLAWVFVPE